MARRIIIPARYQSSRLPQKMLVPIAGKPMLQHTYERAIDAGFDSVIIATDDERILEAAEQFDAPCCLTSQSHPSGTDRCAEAFVKMNYTEDDIIVNLQGDEPLMPSANLQAVADHLQRHSAADVATLCDELHDRAGVFNPNLVKVVRDKNDYALYFSRAPIPWGREDFPNALPQGMTYYLHVGLYAYRGSMLKRYRDMTPSPLESAEMLEQLRVLWHGGKIYVGLAPEATPPGVDTAASLQEVRAILEGQ